MSRARATGEHARPSLRPFLLVLLLAYALASLIHFIHNATFLASYPNLPSTWTANGIYLAWLAITAVGALGAFLLVRRQRVAGLCFIVIYAVCGLDSLGHYVLAPMAKHSRAMNATILLEVGTATLVLVESLRQFVLIWSQRTARIGA